MRWRKALASPRRILVVALLVAFIVHLIATGRWWLWNVFSVVPPLLFVLVPLAFVVWAMVRRDVFVLSCAVISLAIGWTQADINTHAFGARPTVPANATTLTVFNWNTRFWNEERDGDFYAFLRSQDADVYQLQEYWDRRGRSLNLRVELEKEFPGYSITISGELVTATRLPVVSQYGDERGRFLRVDTRVGGEDVSFYNVHVSMQLGPDMPGIFRGRHEQFHRLETDLTQNARLAFIAGDFNSTTSMGVLGWLRSRYQDSITASTTMLPRTWQFHRLRGIRLWRLDFAFVDPRMTVVSYDDIDTGTKSDHNAQLVTIAVQRAM